MPVVLARNFLTIYLLAPPTPHPASKTVLLIFNNQTPAIYLGILLIPLAHILLFKSTIGLRIRAIGEYPQAAATAGINVHKYQFFAVILSGMLTGFAGGIIAPVRGIN